MIELVSPHKVTRINRYQALDWDDGFQPVSSSNKSELVLDYDDEDKTHDRSEAPRTRPPQPSTIFDPQHAILQNRLRNYLLNHYGKSAVRMEKNHVDMILKEAGKITFLEIKMESTVKNCIRLALGQIIEYAHYPNSKKADDLLVVGDATPTSDDEIYLQFMRDTYRIPIHYAQWLWTSNELADTI